MKLKDREMLLDVSKRLEEIAKQNPSKFKKEELVSMRDECQNYIKSTLREIYGLCCDKIEYRKWSNFEYEVEKHINQIFGLGE